MTINCHLLNDSDDGITKDIIFCCLIICLIDFLIQPPDLNEVFWLVYNILIPQSSVKSLLAYSAGKRRNITIQTQFLKALEDSCAVALQGATIVNKGSDSNSIPNIQSSTVDSR